MSKLNIHLADTLLPPLVDQPATHRSLIKRKVETLIYYVIRLWIWPWIGYYTGGPGTKLIRQRFRSFEENDEKLINRIVSANTCLSKHLSREYFISLLKISGESWDYNIFNLKYRNIEILFFVCCSVTRFEQVESRLIFTFSIRVWKFLSIDARWTLALQWTILQSVSTFFKYQLSNSIMEHYEDNQTKSSSWYGFMEFEKDLMRKIGWIIETNFDRIRAKFRSIPAQREKMIARQS